MRFVQFLKLVSRMRYVAAGSIAAVAIMATPGAAFASSGEHCTQFTADGQQCISVSGTALNVQEVAVWFMPPNNAYLKNLQWRIDLQRYPCDPIGVPEPDCQYTTVWNGKTQNTPPPTQGSWCTTVGNGYISVQNCETYGEAFFKSESGYWSTLPVPKTFDQPFWMCAELAVYNTAKKKWNYYDQDMPNGLRACVQIS